MAPEPHRRGEAAASSASPGRPGSGDPLDELFRKFRVPVVRLVEAVTDEIARRSDGTGSTARDPRAERTTFGKWSLEILLALHARPDGGFEELRRSLAGISARVLSLKLSELERQGMVHREIIGTRPPRVRYALTERGWNVAWLAQPILLYLRVRGPGYSPDGTAIPGLEPSRPPIRVPTRSLPEATAAVAADGSARRASRHVEPIAPAPARPGRRGPA